jgi:thermopsin
MNFSIISLTPGTYNYNVTVTDNSGQEVSSPSEQIQINNQPQISLNVQKTIIDLGQTLTVNYNITGGTPPFIVSYFLNGENVGTSLNISEVGRYSLYAHLSDGAGYSANSSQISITVNPPPQINLHFNKTTMDVGSFIILNMTGIGGTPPYRYAWYVNKQVVSDSASLNFSPPAPGNYTVYGVLMDSAGYSTNSSQIFLVVNPKPSSAIGGIIDFIVVVIVIGLAYMFIRRRKGALQSVSNAKREMKEDDALKILKIRYAKGEITKKQYNKMLKDLK